MNKKISAIIKAGLIVGTLDILTAFVHYYIKTGKNPLLILKYIASAAFGKEQAYGSGNIMLVPGLLFHYLIAFSFTVFYFFVFYKVQALLKSKFLTGIVYGLFIWAVMNRVVLPLSKLAPIPFNPANAAIAATILILCIGIPLAFMQGNTSK